MKTTIYLIVLGFLFSCTSNSSEEKAGQQQKLTFIDNPASVGSGESNLFTDKSGNTYLSWVESNDRHSVLKFATLDESTWSGPQTIVEGDDWFVNWADFPMVVSDGEGHMAAHYLAKTAAGTYAYGVFMVFSNDHGKTWSDPIVPHETETASEHGFVSLLPYDNGYFAAWLDGRNTVNKGPMTIRAATMDYDGNIKEEFLLDDRICDCCQTSAAMTSAGPVVLYRDRSEEEIRDMSIVRYVEGNFTEPSIIYPDEWMIPGCPVNGPVVAANRTGMAFAWYTAPKKGEKNDNMINFAYSNDSGVTISEAMRIDDGNPIGRVDMEMLEDGSIFLSLVEDTGVGADIRVKHIDPSGKELDSFTLAKTSVSRQSGFPRMTKNGDRLVFTWRDVSDEENPVVKTAIYRL